MSIWFKPECFVANVTDPVGKAINLINKFFKIYFLIREKTQFDMLKEINFINIKKLLFSTSKNLKIFIRVLSWHIETASR